MEIEATDHVNTMPEEVLLEIFKYLGTEDLKEAVLVCKSWNQLIVNCAETMKQLPLVICYESPVLEALDISRTIQKIVLHLFSPDDPSDLLTVLQKHGKEVRELVIRKMCTIDANMFVGILELLPQLRKISLDDNRFNYYDEILQRVATPHLTHVVLNETHPTILSFFDTSRVVSLKQANFNFPLVFKQLPALKELHLRRYSEKQSMDRPDSWEKEVEIASPALKKLSLAFPGDDLMMSILEKVKDSVEELGIEKQASAHIFEYIFKNFHKLKQLELNLDEIPTVAPGVLRPMPGVKKLVLRSGNQLHDRAYPFIGSLPNIETLVLDSPTSLDDDSNPFLSFVAVNLPKLSVLEMQSVGNSTFKDLTMPSLRTLLIHGLTVKGDGLKSMTQCCANITKLAVESPFFLSHPPNLLILTLADDLKKLQWIYLGSGFDASEQILDHVFENLSDLKTFTLMEDAVKDEPELVSKFPRLIVAKKSVKFTEAPDAYAGEDVQYFDYDQDIEGDFGSDFDEMDEDLDEEDDEFVRYDDLEDWRPEDDENSDDDYTGYERPG